jgi:hypothetical protein
MDMKHLKKHIILAAFLILILGACSEYNIFVEPKAEIVLEKTNFDVLEPVYVQNTGSGETFTFWPGDEGQDYSQVDVSRNEGLPPNRGNDFEYSYLRSGTYTLTVIASSYNEETGKYTQDISTVQITINPGNNGNNFTRFAIDNAFAGYSPEGIIEDTHISIPIAFVNRVWAPNTSDSAYAGLINRRPPLFSVNSSSAKVYSEEGTLLIGKDLENYALNLIDKATLDPIVRKFTVVQDGISKEYSVAAIFYPEISNLSVLGTSALQYSEDGVSSANEDEIKKYQIAYPDKTFYGVFLVGVNENTLKNATLDFDLPEDVSVYLKETGEQIVQNVTTVDFTNAPVVFRVKKSIDGFSVESEFSVYITVF